MKRAVVSGLILLMISGLFSGCIFPRENIPPQAVLVASSTFIDVNEGIFFSANNSVDKDGKIVRYFWDFGDGTNETGKYVAHDYEAGGNYTVILIITDNDGKKALQTITIHVNELPVPVIDIQVPAYIHEEVNFYANDSYDKDGFITGYVWSFSNNANATGMSAQATFTAKETSWVTLTVTDNDGAKAATTMEFPVIFRTYEVKWEVEEVLVDPLSGYLVEENSEHLITEIDILNITRIKFNLTWSDDIPNIDNPLDPQPNDDFILNITSPDEDYYEKGPGSGEKILVYAPKTGDMNPIPEPFEIEAESASVLRGLLAQNHSAVKGTGDWILNITLVEAGGAKEFPIPFDLDEGNSWQLMVVCYYYTPVITKL